MVTLFRRTLVSFAFVVSFAAIPRAATAQPETAVDSNGECLWQSQLLPFPAMSINATNCITLNNALVAAGFTGPRWNIEYDTLAGAIVVVDYHAWVTEHGELQCGAITSAAAGPGRIGGAIICLEYIPGPGDPVGGGDFGVHWISAFSSNCGGAGGVPSFPHGGFIDALDIDGNPRDAQGHYLTPFYDPLGAANQFNFLDAPYDSCAAGNPCDVDCTTTFCTFIASYEQPHTPTGPATLHIWSTGVEWGYHFTCQAVAPTPSAAAVLGMGGLIAFKRRRAA